MVNFDSIICLHRRHTMRLIYRLDSLLLLKLKYYWFLASSAGIPSLRFLLAFLTFLRWFVGRWKTSTAEVFVANESFFVFRWGIWLFVFELILNLLLQLLLAFWFLPQRFLADLSFLFQQRLGWNVFSGTWGDWISLLVLHDLVEQVRTLEQNLLLGFLVSLPR